MVKRTLVPMKAHRRCALLVAVLVAVTASVGSTGGSAFAARHQQKADPDGVMKYGFDLTSSGGARFDPLVVPAGGSLIAPWAALIYDQIIRFDQSGAPAPGLAAAWRVPDPQTVELDLRKGVKFQDGTPFNAAAVKFSLDRAAANPVWKQQGDFAAMTSVDVTGEHSVTIHLNKPVAAKWIDTVLQDATLTGVVSPTAVQKLGDRFNEAPVGAGPFTFERFVPEQLIELRRNDDFWQADKVRLAGVDFVQAAQQARVNGLRSGDLDGSQITAADLAALEGLPNVKVVKEPSTRVNYFIMCTTRPPFNTVDARRAVAYALDAEDFNEKVLNGAGVVSDTFWPEGTQFHAPELTGKYPHSLAKAKKAMRKAGLTSGDFRLMVSGPTASAAGQVAQAQLGEIGLNASIVPTTNIQQDLFADKKAEAAIILVGASAVEFFFLPGAVANWCGYDNPELAAAYQSTKSLLPDDPALQKAWTQSQEYLLDDLLMVPLVAEPNLFAHSSSIGGLKDLNRGGLPPLLGVYVKKGA